MFKLPLLTLALFIFSTGFISPLEARVASQTVTIDRNALKNSRAGRALSDLNKEAKELKTNAGRYPPGSVTHKALASSLQAVRKKQRPLIRKLKAVLGKRVIIYGDKAMGSRGYVMSMVVDGFVRNQNSARIRIVHVWYSDKANRYKVSRNPPGPQEFATTREPATTLTVPDMRSRSRRNVVRPGQESLHGAPCTLRGRRGHWDCQASLLGLSTNCVCRGR